MDLSIVIVNWNTSGMLMRCLRAIYETVCNLEVEVIVVDNASSDDSVQACRTNFPAAKVIVNSENAGFSKANNQGIAVAAGRYILLLNSDAFVHPGSVETVVRFMDAHPDVGAAGCKLLYENGELQRSCTSFPTLSTELWQCLYLDRLFPRSKLFGRYWMSYWDMSDSRPVDAIMGAFMMLRRKALDEVGLLDEDFFFYSEEVDLCYRLWRAGWPVHYVADGTVTHVWGGSDQSALGRRLIQLYASRLHFFRKHYGEAQVVMLKLIVFFASFLRSVSGCVISLAHRSRRHNKLSRGYWQLIRTLPSL
jgi:hypothetical protein